MLLLTTKDLKEYSVQGTDGDLGQVDGFAFNLETWDLEYLISIKSKWFLQTEVFLFPMSVLKQAKNRAQIIPTRLNLENARKVTRQVEKSVQLSDRVNSPLTYWRAGKFSRGFLWLDPYAISALMKALDRRETEATASEKIENDNLRSSSELIGYRVTARGEHLGKIEDLIVDADYWKIRYAVIAGDEEKIMMPAQWIEWFDPLEETIDLNLDKELVLESPYALG